MPLTRKWPLWGVESLLCVWCKVCGSVVWAFPMQRHSKGQPTHSGTRLYPSHDTQLQSVSKNSQAGRKHRGRGQQGDGRRTKTVWEWRKGRDVCVIERVWGGWGSRKVWVGVIVPVCRKGPTPTLTFLCIIWKSMGVTVWTCTSLTAAQWAGNAHKYLQQEEACRRLYSFTRSEGAAPDFLSHSPGVGLKKNVYSPSCKDEIWM